MHVPLAQSNFTFDCAPSLLSAIMYVDGSTIITLSPCKACHDLSKASPLAILKRSSVKYGAPN